ncbi:MAG TPA: hypothetical protein VIF09_07265 [Polyangiaceae bacterium]|jgi:hypothetical protein
MTRAKTPVGRRRTIGLAGVGLLALVGMVAWWGPARPRPSSGAAVDVPAASGSGDFAGKLAIAYSGVVPPASSAPDDDGQRQRYLDKTRETLEHYLAFSVFPPWSRPADDSQRNIVHWNEPIPKTWTVGGDEDQVYVDMELDKIFAARGETLTATARAYHLQADGTKVAVPFDAAGEVRYLDEEALPDPQQPPYEPGWLLAGEVPFADGAGGTKVASFVPSSIPALAAGSHRTEFVGWIAAGGQRLPMPMSFRYATEAPFEVVGGRGDHVDQGSLVVDVAVKVTHVEPVMVQAVLYDVSGQNPVATYDSFFRPTTVGIQTMSLTFFAKAIHDSGVDGPYSVRALHGNVEVTAYDEVFWKYDTPIPTARYRARDFSDAEWKDPERAAKVQQYQALIEGIQSGVQ